VRGQRLAALGAPDTLTDETEPDGELQLRRIGEETLIHDRAAGRVCFLNGTASRVWEMLSAGSNTADIAAALCRTYDAPDEGEVRKHVENCRAELQRLGLTHRAPGETREDAVDEA